MYAVSSASVEFSSIGSPYLSPSHRAQSINLHRTEQNGIVSPGVNSRSQIGQWNNGIGLRVGLQAELRAATSGRSLFSQNEHDIFRLIIDADRMFHRKIEGFHAIEDINFGQ